MENQFSEIRNLIEQKDLVIRELSIRNDSIKNLNKLSEQILEELKIHFPNVDLLNLNKAHVESDSSNVNAVFAMIGFSKSINETEKKKLIEFLKVRLNEPGLQVGFREEQ